MLSKGITAMYLLHTLTKTNHWLLCNLQLGVLTNNVCTKLITKVKYTNDRRLLNINIPQFNLLGKLLVRII